MQQRGNLAVMPFHEGVIRPFVVARPVVLHAVLFGEALHLAVAEHGQARQGRHQGSDAEELVARTELVDGRALVRVRHEVDVALHDAGVELKRIFQHLAVIGIVLIAQHHHKRRVIDAVHAQGTDKIALHQPKRFRQQQRAGHLTCNPVHHLAPKLLGNRGIELGGSHGGLGTRRDGASGAGRGKPEPLDVAFRKCHCSVETNNGKLPGDLKDGLDDLFAHRTTQIIELRGIVPGEAGAIVAVVDILLVAGPLVAAQKNNSGVGLLVIVVLNPDLDAVVPRQIGPIEAIDRVGRIAARQEPFRVLDDPGRVNAHMVRHHVGGKPDAVPGTAVAQIAVSRFAAESVGNLVVI